MKQFIFKIAIYIFLIAIFAGMSFYIDPFNVLHPFKIRDNGVEPNKNYIKMTYILSEPKKFDAFIFGSSRVGRINVKKITNKNCYNMTYSAGLPAEHLANLKTFFNNGVIPETIYMGIDSLSYTTNPYDHLTEQLRSPYEYLKGHSFDFIKMYTDPAITWKSQYTTLTYTPSIPLEEFRDLFYSCGSTSSQITYGQESAYDFSQAQPTIGNTMRMDEVLEEIEEIVRLCKENNTELVVFTNPMYDITYKASLEKDYMSFLYRLADITPFYNFSGFNNITLDSNYFQDPSHYKTEVGDMLIEVMLNGGQYDELYEQGFGVYVTPENVEEFLDILDEQNRIYYTNEKITA